MRGGGLFSKSEQSGFLGTFFQKVRLKSAPYIYTKRRMSALGAFNTQLIRFFEQLADTYPEERDIKMSLEAIRGAKLINPKLILDLFYEHVFKELHEIILQKNADAIIDYAKKKIANQFNEMSPALAIFDKHWATMTVDNQDVIWKYLQVLCVLCERARAAKMPF
jgi:hypothetical protein